jgi:transcriptional regulator with XRE-family HTH domain
MFILAKRIHELRKQRGLTQLELGNLLGVSKVTICGYEKGNRQPSLLHLERLAQELGTSITYLVGEEVGLISENTDARISEDEMNLLRLLKEYPDLYEPLLNNPENTVKLLSRKII